MEPRKWFSTKCFPYFINLNLNLMLQKGFLGVACGILLCGTAVASAAETTVNGVIEQVTGKRMVYSKYSAGSVPGTMAMSDYEQDDMMTEIVWGDNGEVYFYNLFSKYSTGSYIKGTVKDNTILVPVGQPVAYFPSEKYGLNIGIFKGEVLTAGSLTYRGYFLDESVENVEFMIADDGDVVLTLPDGGTFEFEGAIYDEYVLGLYWSDDNTFSGYCEFSQIYTTLPYEVVSVPETLEMTPYLFKGLDSEDQRIVNVGFTDDNIYIQGLCSYLDKGALCAEFTSANEALISNDQILGFANNNIVVAKPGVMPSNSDTPVLDPDAEGYLLTVDKENKVISSKNADQYLVFNLSFESWAPIEALNNFELTPQEVSLVKPANPTALEFSTRNTSWYGYYTVQFTPALEATDGTILDVENLYYSVYLDGVLQSFVEKEGLNLNGYNVVQYEGLTEETTLIPMTLDNWGDISYLGSYLYILGLYNDNFTTVGIKETYMVNGELSSSDIVTLNKETGEIEVTPEGPTTGVNSFTGEKPVSVEYYTLDGKKVANPSNGVFIKQSTYSNGQVKNVKTVVR